MTSREPTIVPAEALPVQSLTPTEQRVARRVLARTAGGTLTLFAFGLGQELAGHTSPIDALAIVMEGLLTLTVGGREVIAEAGTIVRLPANVPHAVRAPQPSRMLLLVLRETAPAEAG